MVSPTQERTIDHEITVAYRVGMHVSYTMKKNPISLEYFSIQEGMVSLILYKIAIIH